MTDVNEASRTANHRAHDRWIYGGVAAGVVGALLVWGAKYVDPTPEAMPAWAQAASTWTSSIALTPAAFFAALWLLVPFLEDESSTRLLRVVGRRYEEVKMGLESQQEKLKAHPMVASGVFAYLMGSLILEGGAQAADMKPGYESRWTSVVALTSCLALLVVLACIGRTKRGERILGWQTRRLAS